MGSAAREADMDIMTQKEHTDEATSPMVLLPLEIKTQILSYLSTQESLSCLSQTCRAWYGPATQELYTRDAKKHTSFAIKWMAAHAVDDHTTDSALRTLKTSRRWGGQIDAVKRRLLPRDGTALNKDQIMYETSTALHFAIILGNMRLMETLLDMKASLRITCRDLPWKTMGSAEVLRRANYFQFVLGDTKFGEAFPIFLAFLKNDPHMCKLLIEHGAGREALIFKADNDHAFMFILHFAAADPTTDYRQWQCLFDGFREYIDEPCQQYYKYTPLHVALRRGCTQGMQIAVECGADMEAGDVYSYTPLHVGIRGTLYHVFECIEYMKLKPVEKPMTCLRKFVELGASVNPEGNSVLVLAVVIYVDDPVYLPNMRRLIDFLLDHHADIHGTHSHENKTVLNEIIKAILYYHQDPPTQELVKKLLIDLGDRGLNLRTPAPGSPSLLYRVLKCREARLEWLLDLLCEKGATVHENEVDIAFIHWCMIPHLWRTNEYNAWWQRYGLKHEIFQKWCEDPHNAWWWKHAKRISAYAAKHAYGVALNYEYRKLYNTLTHLPLPAPSDRTLVRQAFKSKKLWSWRLVVYHKFEDKSLATLTFDKRENMVHLTVRKYVAQSCYSTIDAVLAVLHLRDKGVNMSSPNSHGETPLDLLLRSGSCKDDVLELVALLEGKMDVESWTQEHWEFV
ncbi:uncharacterized protein CPUR_05645 [Claviceps purpurea 20.1]|uniref:F-box domain-containing protein n=1 Tax=Claviceps purpurea (strain 20.1) TaxID=1111077 RepID=M1W8C7_CLAP2|nr:uncharacterized protein CPUR_05645 [Claviceps purpurea 20.1]